MAKEKNTQQNAEADVQAAAETSQKPETAPSTDTKTVELKSMSREELAEKTKAFAKEYDGKRLIYGAVGRNGFTGEYVQRIDII